MTAKRRYKSRDTVDVATFVVECTWLSATDFMCLCPPTARLSSEEENGHAPRFGRCDAEEHGGLLPASLLVLFCQAVYSVVMMRLERTEKPTSDSVSPALGVCWIGESVL
jgi:hypothetical protein